jgi:phospholipid/cholesterol/gamma-HCH transport system substrate-binding protein
MRSKSNLPILVTYMVLSLAVLGLVVAQLGVTLPWQHPYTLTVDFSETAGILTNNDVDMNGVQVGHVGSVVADNGMARVQLIIDDASALPIYKDASAEVRTKNILGETYIDLQRGSDHCAGCQLDSGATLGVDHTVPITEIDQVLAIFDPTTVHRVQFILDAAGNGVTNNGSNLNSGAGYANQLITSLNGPAVELSVRDQQIQDIVLELQRLYDMLAAQRVQVRDEFGTWNQVMAQLAAQDASVATTVQQADQLLASLNTLLSGEGGNIVTTLNQLPGTLTQTEAFLSQSDAIFANVLQYRGSIHDVFPNLASSFADTDANGQHFWSVYAVNCNSSCGNASPSSSAPASYSGGGPSWAAQTVSSP